MPPIRQTQSYLRSLFAENGISPQRRLGQNFLIDLNIHDLIVKTAELDAGDVILEIGPGAGALTSLTAPGVAAVVAVEVDPAMARLTARATAGLGNVQVLNLDALAGKNTINPAVLDHVRRALAAGDGRRFKLVANLPYHVATPVITNFLVHPDLCPEQLVVTIQREMADRLCATPSTPAYGAVSVVVQALADVALVRSLPPSVFWPRPKVDSAVVAIRPSPERRAAIGDVAGFQTLVRRTFQHRRKYLRHVLAGIWPECWTKADVDQWLESHGQSGQIRAEALGIEEFVALAHDLLQRFGRLPHNLSGSVEKPRYKRDECDPEDGSEQERE
jgi:16S rRNA (adenine1518-N6/adenine1519-N6)-dimethyltransferase